MLDEHHTCLPIDVRLYKTMGASQCTFDRITASVQPRHIDASWAFILHVKDGGMSYSQRMGPERYTWYTSKLLHCLQLKISKVCYFIGERAWVPLTGDDGVKVLGVPQQLHGCVVDVHVAQLHIWVVLGHSDHYLLPKLADLQHIGLLHAAKALLALLSCLKRHPRNALYLQR